MYRDIQITIQIYWRFAKFRLNFPALCHFLKKSKQTQGNATRQKAKKSKEEIETFFFPMRIFLKKKNPILRQSDYF